MSRATQDAAGPRRASCTGLSPSMTAFSNAFHSPPACRAAVLQPRLRIATQTVWAVPRSLATTWGIIVYFLFLGVLRCFSSPGSPSLSL